MKRTKLFSPYRGKAAKKFNGRAKIDALYKDSRWVKFSREFLAVNTRCYCCGGKSEVVDHLKAHKGDVKLFTQKDNMIPLCKSHHNRITASFDRHPVQKFDDKMKFMFNMRQQLDLTFKVYVIETYEIEGEENARQ